LSAAPPSEHLFEPLRDVYGWRLALVFKNHSPDGLCPWFRAGRCHHCDIGGGEGGAGDLEQNRARLRWFEQRYQDALPKLAHLVLYDSGSVLSPKELPGEFLDEVCSWARALPSLEVVSLDTREPFVRAARLVSLAELLGPSRSVRPILGLETADDALRALIDKRMPRSAVLRVFDEIAQADAGSARVGLDVNVVVGGPGTTDATAVADAVGTARFAWEQGASRGISVDLNLHPYYPSVRGLARFPDHPRCSPEVALESLCALADLHSELGADGNLFVGWQDEGHDQEQDERQRELDRLGAGFDLFNQTQDPSVLPSRSPARRPPG